MPRMLFSIGAQKSGTTWVHEMLAGHPQVAFPPLKELHVFSGRFDPDLRPLLDATIAQVARISGDLGGDSVAGASTRRWLACYRRAAAGDDDAYKALFPEGGHRLTGDFTPAYALLPLAGFRHVRRLFPDARLLFVLREPVARIWSQVAMDAARQPERFAPDQVPAAERARRLATHALSEPCLVRSRYAPTLEHLARVFPAPATMIAFYEDIFAGPDGQLGFLDRLCGHCGIDFDLAHFPGLARRVHAAPPLDMPAGLRARLIEATAPTVEAVRALVGRVPDSWRAAR